MSVCPTFTRILKFLGLREMVSYAWTKYEVTEHASGIPELTNPPCYWLMRVPENKWWIATSNATPTRKQLLVMNHPFTFMVMHDLLHALKKDQPEPEKRTVGRGNALDLTQQFQVRTIRPISKTSAGVVITKNTFCKQKPWSNILKLYIHWKLTNITWKLMVGSKTSSFPFGMPSSFQVIPAVKSKQLKVDPFFPSELPNGRLVQHRFGSSPGETCLENWVGIDFSSFWLVSSCWWLS